LLLGYFGFQNLGDELLWRTFLKEAQELRPDIRWKLLNRDTSISGIDVPHVETVSRSDFFETLETLANSKAIVVPGGSVLQSATSSKSLIYYLFYIFLGKILGARVLLPGQGLGPWESGLNASSSSENRNFFYPSGILVILTRIVLDFSDYLSVRDSIAADTLKALPPPPLIAPITADLVFLNAKPSNLGFSKVNEKRTIGVILRASVPGSEKIAEQFCLWEKKNAQMYSLIPIAFQPQEDEIIWNSNSGGVAPIKMFEKTQDVFRELSCLDVLVSMRFHGCVLATILGIPWIGLSNDPKTSGFAKDINWKFLINPLQFEIDIFFEMLQEQFQNYSFLVDGLTLAYEEKHKKARADINSCLKKISENN
ncbi:polysaccharide pyruvyl transferase family protein, partial [bacterium]|nr:polysaccharide pyruvyl transferase family protein [bacterium]